MTIFYDHGIAEGKLYIKIDQIKCVFIHIYPVVNAEYDTFIRIV